jgi:ketosteroid isomerase-like protein
MSEQSVAIVEGLYGGAADADMQTLLATLPALIAQACDPEIEWIEDPQRADGKVYRGHAGVQESFERWLEHFDEFGYEAERFIDCGEDVLVVGREHARGSTSGAAISSRHYSIVTVRAGKILRFREFYDEQAAFAAAGLAE